MASTSDDELTYLTPGFDPNTLTVPRLRSILVNHDIQYPASAKKAQLVDVFNNELVPKSRKILSARSRTKRTSKGITDMPSSQEGSVAGGEDDDASLMPPPPVPETPRRRTKKSPTNGELTPVTTRKKTPASRRSSSKHARASDTDTTDGELKPPSSSARKVRRSTTTPSVKIEEPTMEFGRKSGDDSVFSDDNPFQSGSPSTPPKSSSRRKISSSLVKDPSRRRSESSRRKTEGNHVSHVDDEFIVPSSKKFQPKIKTEEIEAGEEFTPEEQLDLASERARTGGKDVLPPRRKTPKRPAGGISKSAPWIVILTLLSGYAIWWRQEKVKIGYCGFEQASTSLTSNHQVPDWAKVLEPQCESCPQHAICYPNLKTRCETDFVLKSHPLALGGLVPLPPTCEPDSEKVRKVSAVADRAVEELRERRAKWECGDLTDENGKLSPTPEIETKELKEMVASKRRKGMSEFEFEDLWKGAIGEIEGREEVVATDEGLTGRRLLSSTSYARLPIGCAVRRSARLALARYRVHVAFLIVAALSILYARATWLSRQEAAARVPALVELALDGIRQQATLHARDPVSVPESFLSVTGLRDEVLRNEFSAARRKKLWDHVKAIVEQNSNVRSASRENRSGDIVPVWEWTGSLPALDWDTDGRRESSRFSLSGFGSSSSLVGSANASPAPAGPEEKKNLTFNNRWDEGRPIY